MLTRSVFPAPGLAAMLRLPFLPLAAVLVAGKVIGASVRGERPVSQT